MSRIIQRTMIALTVVLVAGVADAQCDPQFVLLGGSQPEVVGGNHPIPLPTGGLPPTSIVNTTVTEYEEWGFSFVTDDQFVHLIHYDSTAVEMTLDLKADTGLPGLVLLYDASAARPVRVADETRQSALYVVGLHSYGMFPEPYYFVLDQKAIMDRWESLQAGQAPTQPYILGSGKLCVSGQPCAAMAGEVQVFSPTGSARHQEAYVQMLDFQMPVEQRIMRLSRTDQPTAAWQVSLAHDLDPGTNDWPNLGFAFDRESEAAWAAVGEKILEVNSNPPNFSCKLGSTVSDLVIWSIAPESYTEFTATSYTFVTSSNTVLQTSKLVGFPTGTCPDTQTDSTVEVSVPYKALKVALFESADNELGLRVLSSDGTVTEVMLEILPGAGASGEDDINVTNTATTQTGSGAIDLTPKPNNLCSCSQVEVFPGFTTNFCLDNCTIDEGGYTVCDNHSEPPPPVCIDPNDTSCPTTVRRKK